MIIHTIFAVLVFVLCLAGCAPCARCDRPGPSAHAEAGIVGEWNVERVDGGTAGDAGDVFLGFGADGRVYGNTGVNRLLGSWSNEDGVFGLDGLGSTQMAGPADLMAIERRLLDALGRSVRVELNGDGNLVFRSEDGTPVILASPR